MTALRSPASIPDVARDLLAAIAAWDQAAWSLAKELPPQAAAYFATLIERHGLPPGLAKVMRHIPPGQISLPDLVGLIPAGRFEAISTGTSRMHTVNALPGGEVISVPATWALIRPRTAS